MALRRIGTDDVELAIDRLQHGGHSHLPGRQRLAAAMELVGMPFLASRLTML